MEQILPGDTVANAIMREREHDKLSYIQFRAYDFSLTPHKPGGTREKRI
jgi:hypothetical protein